MNKSEYNKLYYQKNRDKIIAKTRIWGKTRRPGTRTFNMLSNVDYRETVVLFLMERDGTICKLCNTLIEQGSEQIDHIIQRAIGGTNEPSNLRLVHKACNANRPKPRRASIH